MENSDPAQAGSVTVHGIDDLPEGWVADYWSEVAKTLVEVFEMAREKALAEISKIRKKMEQSKSETQVYFYHASPFEVAADLAIPLTAFPEGVAAARRITEDQQERYVQMQVNLGNLSEADRPDLTSFGAQLPGDFRLRG